MKKYLLWLYKLESIFILQIIYHLGYCFLCVSMYIMYAALVKNILF